ncbi:MAG: hypothetical protein JWO13_2178 [Acidobacteriales bacterium]|nr:hypothetical protein [Terriglobales bacterium]
MLKRILFVLAFSATAFAQEASTSAVRGSVVDASGAAIANASVVLTNSATDITRTASTGTEGRFSFDLLPPGDYTIAITAKNFAPYSATAIKAEVGGVASLTISMRIAGAQESVSVSADTPVVETQPGAISDVIDERAIAELPINGRRFTDLVLLTPGVTQDPRGLTSSSNGDLSFGGVRGYNSSYLVDGADNNNGFFGQARGRYRAPYQFSNEVVQEFRVSSNTYGAELGRSGGAVVNVVTKSGSNHTHGSAFYYLRDGRTAATHPFVRKKYPDKQDQFGFTIGGPLKRNKIFYFAGFDQHIFHIPTVVQFANGTSQVTPTTNDYEATDKALVTAAADKLSLLGGEFRSALLGNTGFFKTDIAINPHQYLSAKLNISRYYGQNNVFFDPASPITNFATSENGEERVSTESANISLTSALGARTTSHLRVQFSRDLQSSDANSTDPQTKITDLISGFGRSSVLPRRTREHRLNIADTISITNHRHAIKFGGDLSLTRDNNFFPSLFGGEYIYSGIKVNPFTFVPQVGGLPLTPLRAYAHQVPRYYIQNFGQATSRPDTNEYALFLQDTARIGNHLSLSAGVRYDLQSFRSAGLVNNPAWPESGKVPLDTNNISPRLGFAASLGGENRPFVIRGGYGLFYTRIPQIYTSAVELNNGLAQSHLFLDYANFFDRQVFPTYPKPLVQCGSLANCAAPASLASFLTSEISSFSKDFQTPYVQQVSVTVEKEVAKKTAIGVAYLFVTGKHLIRARDKNLPTPISETYPIYDETGNTFTGDFYTLNSFSTWQFAKSLTCPFPPCINDLRRPISNLGAINVFESAAGSQYNGFTLSAKRRMNNGLYFRLAYTYAHAVDDGQDALLTTGSQVQDTTSTSAERAPSVTDQRHRLALAWTSDPHPFHRDHAVLRNIFNDWRLSGILTAGSGRPVNAHVNGDANRDGNTENDRLPGVGRNSSVGPNYISGDMRITRLFQLNDRFRMEASAESFNTFNHQNKRMNVNDDGFANTAAEFFLLDRTIGANKYPAYFTKSRTFLTPTNAYAPRQIQFSLRLKF